MFKCFFMLLFLNFLIGWLSDILWYWSTTQNIVGVCMCVWEGRVIHCWTQVLWYLGSETDDHLRNPNTNRQRLNLCFLPIVSNVPNRNLTHSMILFENKNEWSTDNTWSLHNNLTKSFSKSECGDPSYCHCGKYPCPRPRHRQASLRTLPGLRGPRHLLPLQGHHHLHRQHPHHQDDSHVCLLGWLWTHVRCNADDCPMIMIVMMVTMIVYLFHWYCLFNRKHPYIVICNLPW